MLPNQEILEMTKAVPNTSINETKQEEPADGKQQADGLDKKALVNFSMSAVEEDYELDED